MNAFLILYEIQLENSTTGFFQQTTSSVKNLNIRLQPCFCDFVQFSQAQPYWRVKLSSVKQCFFQPRHLQPFPRMFIVLYLGMMDVTRLLQSIMSLQLVVFPVDAPVSKYQQHRLQQLLAVSSVIQCFLFPLVTGTLEQDSKKIFLHPMISWYLGSSILLLLLFFGQEERHGV